MGFSRQGHWNSLPFLVPGNLLTQGSNWGLLCCRQIPYQLSYQGSLFSSRHMSIVLRPEMTPFVLMLSPNACVGKGAWCNSLSLEVFLLFMISSLLSSVQSLSGVRLFLTPGIAAHQASLSITISWSTLKHTSIESWCHPTILSSVVPFFSCPQSLSASESFPMSQLC